MSTSTPVSENPARDPFYTSDLTSLGFELTNGDQIQSISAGVPFQSSIDLNYRENDVRREAMYKSIRREVAQRLGNRGIRPLYLPSCADQKPHFEKSIPILTTRVSNLAQLKHVVVVVNDVDTDPGIWSYLSILHNNPPIHGTVFHGSAQGLVEALRKFGEFEYDSPGLVLLNLGQLIWSETKRTAMTADSWRAMPRTWSYEPLPNIDPSRNRIPQNTTVAEHLSCVFQRVLLNPYVVNREAKISFIGIRDGGLELVNWLGNHLHEFPDQFQYRILGIALIGENPPPRTNIGGRRFWELMTCYTGLWTPSHSPPNTFLENLNDPSLWRLTRISGGYVDPAAIMAHNYEFIVAWLMVLHGNSVRTGLSII